MVAEYIHSLPLKFRTLSVIAISGSTGGSRVRLEPSLSDPVRFESDRVGDETIRSRSIDRIDSRLGRTQTQSSRSIRTRFLTEPPVLPEIAITDNVRNFNNYKYMYFGNYFKEKSDGASSAPEKGDNG